MIAVKYTIGAKYDN